MPWLCSRATRRACGGAAMVTASRLGGQLPKGRAKCEGPVAAWWSRTERESCSVTPLARRAGTFRRASPSQGRACGMPRSASLQEETGLRTAPEALRDLGIHAYLRDKNLALFAWTPSPMPDPASLTCSATFILPSGAALPEFDRFGLFSWEDGSGAGRAESCARTRAEIASPAGCVITQGFSMSFRRCLSSVPAHPGCGATPAASASVGRHRTAATGRAARRAGRRPGRSSDRAG